MYNKDLFHAKAIPSGYLKRILFFNHSLIICLDVFVSRNQQFNENMLLGVINFIKKAVRCEIQAWDGCL